MRLLGTISRRTLPVLAAAPGATGALRAQATPVTSVIESGHDPVIVERWTTANGLPQNTVTDMIQTRDGYIWLATFGGLARFDGVDFTIYDMAHPDGPPTNRILSLHEGRDGSLWVGGQITTLARLRDGVWSVFPLGDGMREVAVYDITEDPTGNIWLATNRGLGRVDTDGVTFLRVPNTGPNDVVLSVAADRFGTVWLATAIGPARYQEGTFEFPGPELGLPPGGVKGIHFDRRHRMWIVGYSDLWVADEDGAKHVWGFGGLVAYSVKPGVVEDAQGNLIVGGADQLVIVDDAGTVVPVRMAVLAAGEGGTSGFQVRSLLADREGNLWVGSNGAGLSKVRYAPIKRHTAIDTDARVEVWAVTGDGAGGLWMGAAVLGLIHYSGGRRTRITHVGGGRLGEVRTLLRDRSGALWVSSPDSLWVMDAADTVHYELRDVVGTRDRAAAFSEDANGNIWLSTRGLFRVDDGEFIEIVKAESLGSGGTECLLLDGNGAVWLGRTNGLFRYTPDSLARFPEVDGTVRTIHEDESGTLWIGTYGEGLFRMRDGVLTRYTTADGLYDNFVSRIMEDEDGNLWMNGNKGQSFVSRSQLNAFADGEVRRLIVVGFGPEDGAAEGNGSGGWQAEDGIMWFPTIEGLVEVNPASRRRNELPPPVTVERIMLGGDAVDFSDGGFRVPPGGRDIEIKYTALSFVRPRHVRFRYQLSGYDDDWVEAGARRTAYYTSVPPGEYRFRVIASNGDGVWNEEGVTVAVTVLPHLYQTLWLRALAVLLTAAVLYGYFHHRMRRVRVRLEETERFNLQLQESETRFRGASEGSLDAFFLVESVRDDSGEITDFEFIDANERGASLVGLDKKSVIGQRVSSILTATRASGNFAKWVRVVNTGVPFEEVLAPMSPALKAEWVRQQVVKVGDGLAITARDITEEKRSEAEQERLQTQLLRAQKLESVGLLAGGVAHDFNNVLTLVMGHAELGSTKIPEGDPAHDAFKEVLAAGEQGGHLTRQLLALSRRQPSVPQIVDPNARILAFDKMLRRVIGSNYEMSTLPGDGVGAVRFDPGQLEQVLLNLVVNARDALPDGGRITITTRDVVFEDGDAGCPAGLAAGRYAALAVKDDGTGMDAETQQSAFDPFFTTKRSGEGTGLGLATCSTIVSDAGGAIVVESEPDVGSTFTVYVPVVSGDTVDTDGVAGLSEADLRGGETVLCLDDNSSVRAVMTAGLANLGYKVLSASIASEAVELFEGNGDIRLLVADVVLPQDSGVNVARQLQRSRSDLKVLLVSGYTGSEQWDSIVASKYAFLQKPFTVTALARKVREVLDR
jgi:signal transduction histidine kinase/ligand-binding sensor domain-containing protein/CheY-like chemotaxis protein